MIDESEVRPTDGEVLEWYGAPETAGALSRWEPLLDESYRLFKELVKPKAVWRSVSGDDFGRIYGGAAGNAQSTPLEEIFPFADHLRLFATTLGSRITDRISALQQQGEYPLAMMLDALACLAVDRAVDVLQDRMTAEIRGSGHNSKVLAYSPGYCGWSLKGQRILFDRLGPQDIGIRLLPSLLMSPLKSVSGVLIGAPFEIHDVEIGFECCSSCATLDCRERLSRLRRE